MSAMLAVAGLLALVNHARTADHLQPLSASATLDVVAAECGEHHLLACARRHRYHAQAIAMVTAWDQRSRTAVLAAWLDSPAHRALILSSTYRIAGVFERPGFARMVLARPYLAVATR